MASLVIPKSMAAGKVLFYETKDGLPFIGSFPGRDHVLFALCYGANGTNFGVLAANLICDRILGRRNADASLFALNR